MRLDDVQSNFACHLLRPSFVRAVAATALALAALAAGPGVGSAFAGSFSISGGSSPEGGNVGFTVTCTNDFSADCDGASVQVSTSPGTATAADFTSKSETLTFMTSESLNFFVQTTQDALDENDETFTASLSNPSPDSSGSGTATGTIFDDDPLPALSVDDAGVGEANSNSFTVTLDPVSGRAVAVDVSAVSGSAQSNSDFSQSSPSTLTFAPGETSKVFSVPHLCDNTPEGTENYAVNLSNPQNATFARQQGSGTIFDSCTSGAALPPPVLGSSFNVRVLRGEAFISVPPDSSAAGRLIRGPLASAAVPGLKGRTFEPLTAARQVPIGSLLDTRRGTVGISSARDATGKTQSGQFFAGVFQVLQSRRKRAKGLTELRLKGASFRRCGGASGSKRGGPARISGARTIRRLRSSGSGRFRTRGRRSAATVRGTIWTVSDRCDGTLTKVRRGRVAVRDFRRRKTIVLTAGKSYLAKTRR